MLALCLSGSTCLMVSVNTVGVEEQQEQTEANEGRYGRTQQEGIAAFTVDHLQKATHTHTHPELQPSNISCKVWTTG